MITLNPYRNIDFTQCVTLVSNTHEHIFNQSTLESCYNRGVRNINLLHYQPSTPQKLLPSDYQAEYQDFKDVNDLTIITKKCPIRDFHDFVDKNGNNVSLSDIVVVPNCEHVNIKDYPFMLHTNYLGSEFGDPGWTKQDGDTQGGVQWRIDHKFITDMELFAGVRANMPFGKIFGTLNHPTDGIPSYSVTDQFIEHSNGLIKAVEIFSGAYTASVLQDFEDYYDYLLNKGHQLWSLAVVDWQGDGQQAQTGDRGANILLLPSNYNTLSYVEKQNAILDAYIAGTYFPVGRGELLITNVEEQGYNVRFTFNKPANAVYCLYDGNKTLVASNTSSVVINTKKASKYIRIKALGDNNEFVFSNPIFVNNHAQTTVNKFKILF